MTYRIAIIDDNPTDASYVRLLCESWAKSAGHLLLPHEFPSAEQFLFHTEDLPPFDLLLLDIEMGQMNGVELARRVREYDERVQMVFITGYPDFIAEGYEVAALHYLMKPVAKEKLFAVLDRASAALDKQTRTVLLPVGKETVCLPADSIRYAESQGHYMIVYAQACPYKCRMTASELEALLGYGFVRCHRSVVVGLRHVARVTRTAVYLNDGTELPLGKGLYDPVNRALIGTLREM
jgi:DNA-binding LytR/AlgR family response regulator